MYLPYMFDFQNLRVYQKAKAVNHSILDLLEALKIPTDTKSQLRRASFSIMLNIAEGAGRFTKKDRRNFCIISRASIFEVVAILEFLAERDHISLDQFDGFLVRLDELSKMLYAMIRRLEA